MVPSVAALSSADVAASAAALSLSDIAANVAAQISQRSVSGDRGPVKVAGGFVSSKQKYDLLAARSGWCVVGVYVVMSVHGRRAWGMQLSGVC